MVVFVREAHTKSALDYGPHRGQQHLGGKGLREGVLRPEIARRREDVTGLVARRARDAPEVFERMKAGEFCSVAEAERAAGVKVVSDRRVWLYGEGSMFSLLSTNLELLGGDVTGSWLLCFWRGTWCAWVH